MIILSSILATAGQPTKRPRDEARGEELYRRHCVACHGARNGGRGPATNALVHAVPALQGKVTPDEPHVSVVLRGKNAMPGFEASFDRADSVRVLKYMRGLGPDKQLPKAPAKKLPAGQLPDKKAKPIPAKVTPPKKKALPAKADAPAEKAPPEASK